MGDKGLQGTSGICVCKALTLDKFGKGKHTILLQEKQKEALISKFFYAVFLYLEPGGKENQIQFLETEGHKISFSSFKKIWQHGADSAICQLTSPSPLSELKINWKELISGLRQIYSLSHGMGAVFSLRLLTARHGVQGGRQRKFPQNGITSVKLTREAVAYLLHLRPQNASALKSWGGSVTTALICNNTSITTQIVQ